MNRWEKTSLALLLAALLSMLIGGRPGPSGPGDSDKQPQAWNVRALGRLPKAGLQLKLHLDGPLDLQLTSDPEGLVRWEGRLVQVEPPASAELCLIDGPLGPQVLAKTTLQRAGNEVIADFGSVPLPPVPQAVPAAVTQSQAPAKAAGLINVALPPDKVAFPTGKPVLP